MYAYTGYCYDDKSPYDSPPIVLILDNDLRFGQTARVFSSTNGVATSFFGRVDEADMAQFPKQKNTFSLFSDSDHPFEIVRGDSAFYTDQFFTVTMFNHPRTDRNCKAIGRGTFGLAGEMRTKAEDYDPTRGLPIIRCYKPGIYNNCVFLLIVPYNLCTGDELWLFYVIKNGLTREFWATCSSMTVVEEDDSSVTVTVDEENFDGKFKLNKDDNGWERVSWVRKGTASQAASKAFGSEGLSVDRTLVKLPNACVAYLPPLMEVERPNSSHAQTSIVSSVGSSSSWEQHPPNDDSMRTKTTIENNSTDAVLCILDESGEPSTSKVVAWRKMFSGMMASFPTGSKIPLGVVQGMITGAGIYDTFNDPDSPTTAFLFPGEKMTRKTSVKIPKAHNDLTILQAKTENSKFVLRTRLVKRRPDPILKVKELLAEGGFTNLLDISWTIPQGRTARENKIVKIVYLNPATSTVLLTSTVDDCEISDGQVLVQDKSGAKTLYNTLKPNSNFTANTKLFSFHKDKKSVLVYTSGVTGRFHDIFLLPGSMIVVLKLTKCKIDNATGGSKLGNYGSNKSEDLYAKLVREAGYHAYYWSNDGAVKGFKLHGLENASIKFTNKEQDVVYVPISGWLPWQWMV